jgi:hypothetical protein
MAVTTLAESPCAGSTVMPGFSRVASICEAVAS